MRRRNHFALSRGARRNRHNTRTTTQPHAARVSCPRHAQPPVSPPPSPPLEDAAITLLPLPVDTPTEEPPPPDEDDGRALVPPDITDEEPLDPDRDVPPNDVLPAVLVEDAMRDDADVPPAEDADAAELMPSSDD